MTNEVAVNAPGEDDSTPANSFGLKPVEMSLVQELVQKLESGSLDAIHSFGRDVGVHTSQQADALLEQVKSNDLDAIGGRLSEVVVVAKTLNLGSLSDNRSRIPLIGGLIDRLRLKGESFIIKFQDVRTQVDALVNEVEGMQAGLAKRVEVLEHAFESVKEEHALLGAHVAAGEIALLSLNKLLAEQQVLVQSDPVRAQEVQDLKAALTALEKRVADMRMLQHAALQQLPMIRMVQTNNRMLIEKFYTIKELTVPAWKRQFMLTLALNEQQSAVQLANSIDDATNEFLRENARLLKENTIATAKANQRLVIDIETLKEVHESLMSTVQEVVRINKEGVVQRGAATTQLLAMRRELTQQIGGA